MDLVQQITEYYEAKLKQTHLRDLLSDDNRNQQFVVEHDGLLLDYSHEKLDYTVMSLFEKLASTIYPKIDDMFEGEKINSTENRAVLHVALRAKPDQVICVNGLNQVPEVHKVLDKIKDFSARVRSAELQGFTGQPLTTVVVIGIGGSYLGIEFVYEALRTQYDCMQKAQGRKLRFLANVDPVDLERALEGVNPENTLFLISSKTFTTAETMMNARASKKWLLDQYAKLGHEDQEAILKAHLCAVSTNLQATSAFGIAEENVFGFWDWVGGRYSVSSAIGILPLSLHFGFETM